MLHPLDDISNLTYYCTISPKDKDLVWLHGEVKTPPFSLEARLEAGYLLRQLQQGIKLVMPQSPPNANDWTALPRATN